MSVDVYMEGLEGVKGFIGEIKGNLLNRTALDAMGQEARRRVLERTASGTDVHGAPFRPYSKSYRKAREARGLPGARVDLKRTGKMLGAIYAEAKPDKGVATVSFKDSGSALKASYHNDAKGGREFFGLDGRGQDAVVAILEEHIEEVINDAY